MTERTRSTSVALTPTEQEALETLAKAAGVSRSGLIRRWIREAAQGDEPGRRVVLRLNREGETQTGTKEMPPPGEVVQKAAPQPGEAVNVFLPPSARRQRQIARAAPVCAGGVNH